MIPGTLVGLAVFAASIGPGYLYVRLAERREPRQERTPLREAAELLVIGATVTTFAVLVTLAIVACLELVDARALTRAPDTYVVDHPLRVAASLATALALSYGGTWGLAELVHIGKPRDVSPDDTPWIAAFRRDMPKGHGAYVTAELRDGRTVSGAIRAVPTHPDVESTDLYLSAPDGGAIWVGDPNKGTFPIEDRFVLLRASEIVFVSGRYAPSN